MTIHSLADLERPGAALDTEFCVVGAGFAGLLVARRLAQAGRQVVLVESGDARCSERLRHLNEVDDVFGRFTGAMDGRFRGLGGSSSRWTGGMLPLTSNDLGPRSHAGLQGWLIGAADLEPYRKEIEALFRVDGGSFENDFSSGAEAALPSDSDFVLRWMKWPRRQNCHIGRILRAELGRLRCLEVWLDATVCGFSLDPEAGRIAAVKARNVTGSALDVRAREFIFAAGAIETTRLVLLLDAASGGRAFSRCKVLGRYFQDHLRARVGRLAVRDRSRTTMVLATRFVGATRRNLHLELSPQTQASAGVPSAFAQFRAQLTEGSALLAVREIGRALQLGRLAASREHVPALMRDPAALMRLAWWRYMHGRLDFGHGAEIQLEICTEQVPAWDSRLSLSEKRDAFGCPKVRLEWRPSEGDERTFRFTVNRLGEYWRRNGLDRMCSIEWGAETSEGRAITEAAVDMYHPSGSTRMGHDAEQSVVGADLRCHEVANLSLVSASVFPAPGSANPTFTIMQIALRAADDLLRRAARSGPNGSARAFPTPIA